MFRPVSPIALGAALLAALGSAPALAAPAGAAPQVAEAPSPEAQSPDDFVRLAEADYASVLVEAAQADWVYQTHITPDTEALTARANARLTEVMVGNATRAARFAQAPGLSFDTARKLSRMRTMIVSPAPSRPGAAEEVATIQARLQGLYGKGQGTRGGKPIGGSDIEEAMGTSRDPVELAEMWTSWHDNVGAPMRQDFARMVGLFNEGARELGYADAGALWRANYDMDGEEFVRLTERLWNEVRPLYEELHCYARAKLNARYGAAVQPATGPIRADLLGNMWAQEWGNIYDVVAPPGAGDIGYDLGGLLVARGYDPARMVRAGEGFFSSLGFENLPATFWERSQFVKPRDREVVCHASAWDIDNLDDLRIKMCIKVNADDFVTIHHELGHNYYQRAYKAQPALYLDGANDGFHEAIGDMVALSITPEYLVRTGLLERARAPGADKDIGLLLRQAMDKVAFLPFGLLIDRWRWQVFSGEVPPDRYQQAWTELRRRYQGVAPPSERPAGAFDPGAKYHVPANVPYTRYFLARLLQFQFFEAACRQAGWKGPLHRCSFQGDAGVGERLGAMMAMGASRPWPDALEAFTGSRAMSGKPLLRYFAPLAKWLRAQNRGRACGW